MDINISKSKGLRGEIEVPGDKSISHRAIMLLPISSGKAVIHNFLKSEDCYRTVTAMRLMGANIKEVQNNLVVEGVSKKGLRISRKPIYTGNSGTTVRLLSGILSGINGSTVIYGDDSLNNRPMGRIATPLIKMGADLKFIHNDQRAPFVIKGGNIRGIDFKMENASAQVKSCIMLASLLGEGKTIIHEIAKSRDHTERMLSYLGYDIRIQENKIEMICGGNLQARDVEVPGDMSSAAFIIAAGILIPESEIIIRNVLLNYTRSGFIEVVKNMGAEVEILDIRYGNCEEIGDIRVKYSEIHSITLEGSIIPRIIDELPLIAMLAAFAHGTSKIKDANELRFKESNRIESVIYNLRQLGVNVHETEDGMEIEGRSGENYQGVIFNSFKDHRIAMSFIIAGLLLDSSRVEDIGNIETSFPGFCELLKKLGANIKIL